jgi:hypothetical protein
MHSSTLGFRFKTSGELHIESGKVALVVCQQWFDGWAAVGGRQPETQGAFFAPLSPAPATESFKTRLIEHNVNRENQTGEKRGRALIVWSKVVKLPHFVSPRADKPLSL